MKEIDWVMEQIKDSKWHGVDEMKQKNVSEKKLNTKNKFSCRAGFDHY